MAIIPRRVSFELVPSPLWGVNPRSRMGESAWREVGRLVRSVENNVCFYCGAAAPVNHCHEAWSYDDKSHIQCLNDIHCVCVLCHGVKHFGLTSARGYFCGVPVGVIVAHYLRVNDVSLSEMMADEDDAYEIWLERSEFEWSQDISRLWLPPFESLRSKFECLSGVS